ncbi:MAG: class I SAM-dependent methyltransferase [Alphaproteobacteria bacterium]|nr:class I SAM-dependent methyltransferase [Alphaproteobacteria bacterium]
MKISDKFPKAQKWDFENGFFLTATKDRLSKTLAHYELFCRTLEVPGEIVEFGVFKGVSFSRWCLFRSMFSNVFSKQVIGFDTFGAFPETGFEDDFAIRKNFVDTAGEFSVSAEDMRENLQDRNLAENIKLVPGDILETLPAFLRDNPQMRFSLVNLDTDIYEPAKCILENVWNRIVRGGVLILDDYGTFAGETKAVEEFLATLDNPPKILRFPFASTPCYLIKE